MADDTRAICPGKDKTQLERPNWYSGMVVEAADLTAEQDYFRQKKRRHNFYLHGWGVVCGLEVTATPTVEQPRCIRISEGYALGPYGDEIFVPEPVTLDLATCIAGATTGPCEPSAVAGDALSGPIYIAISYVECLKDPKPLTLNKCGCPEEACEYSRVQDSYKISCLGALPGSHQIQVQRLCDLLAGDHIIDCPSCPDDGNVVLAEVTLPGTNVQITNTEIDNMARLPLASTRLLQEQLEACCCEGGQIASTELARVTSVPDRGEEFEFTVTASGDYPGEGAPENIILTFSKLLNVQTVNAQTIRIVMRALVQPSISPVTYQIEGELSYTAGQMNATFVPNVSFAQMVLDHWDYSAPDDASQFALEFTISVIGDNGIVDEDGFALDGDGDGEAGGNFISTFTITALARMR